MKKTKSSAGAQVDVPIVPSPSDPMEGEINPEVDDEDTEEMIEALAKEVKWAAANLPPDSAECCLITSLFLKVQGFVAKVCEVNFGCNKRCLKPSRCTGHHK
jgi:hypothetical protein